MTEEPQHGASPAYSVNQLRRALDRAGHDGAQEKIRRWQDVLAGMTSGRITVGSRTPVADTPAWVTLEVAHGGFATGRYLAETPLNADEQATVATLPDDVPGETDRERLNLWYLGDTGQAELLAALRSGRYRVEIPEEAALAVVALLLDEDEAAQALDLVAELRPFLHRLRCTPRFEPGVQSAGTSVRLMTAAEAAASLRAVRVPGPVAAMRETLLVWTPLYDRLVELWCHTVDGDAPRLAEDGSVHGGWPVRQWPEDWAAQREAWLADYARTVAVHEPSGKYAHRRGNFARLHRALVACADHGAALSGREVGWIRRALANTLTRHGEPGSQRRTALRAAQEAVATRPTFASIAAVLATRLDRIPADGGVPDAERITAAVSEQDGATGQVPDGTAIPDHLAHKAMRALEAPVDELVERGVITSGDALAEVLPQFTARLTAAAIEDPAVAGLYEQTYTAFRRRRSLLLLDLASQVRFTELPWIAALTRWRTATGRSSAPAHQALRQLSMLALTAFPAALLPNPLVSELIELAKQADIEVPLVSEVAADIFMGTFTTTWRDAAVIASRSLAGTLYTRYYDLPPESRWPTGETVRKWRRNSAAGFTGLCGVRAQEAGTGGGYVARNGAILEQSQILTTHNLAALVDRLDLTEQLREQAPRLAERTLDWVVHRLEQPTQDYHAALIKVKKAAYAWRQAIYLLSFCPQAEQARQAEHLRAVLSGVVTVRGPFAPALAGLVAVIDGAHFTEEGLLPDGTGRRFLGWAAGSHWLLKKNDQK